VLSIGLMGGGSCRFSSGTTNEDDEKPSGSEVHVVVGTHVEQSGDDSRSDSDPGQAAVLRTALEPSVLSLPARSAVPAPDGADFVRAATETRISVAQSQRAWRSGGASAIPEPTAALSFAVGAFVIALRLRHARFDS
jgi:hypothetical protein